jgi:hypothetical protein
VSIVTMKNTTILILVATALLCLPSCGLFRKPPPTVKTTTTRSMPGLMGGPGGVETTIVEKPYDPFGEGAAEAGKLMFSQP